MLTTNKGNIVFYLRTQRGEQYHITQEGYIIRLDQPDFMPSKGWQFLGIHHVKKNMALSFNELTPETLNALKSSDEWQYKNGNPQWTVMDLDHGTRRHWGDGVSVISRV